MSKGSKPRNLSKKFRENYEQIDWKEIEKRSCTRTEIKKFGKLKIIYKNDNHNLEIANTPWNIPTF